MDGRIRIFFVAAVILSLLLAFVNIYLAGIAFIVFLVLIMTLAIMQDARLRPDIWASLAEDAKGIILLNTGTAPAVRIHVALVPLDIEFDLPGLAVDAKSEHPLPGMVSDAKAVLTWENSVGERYSRTVRLSALGTEEDFLKPMFPMFGWKSQ